MASINFKIDWSQFSEIDHERLKKAVRIAAAQHVQKRRAEIRAAQHLSETYVEPLSCKDYLMARWLENLDNDKDVFGDEK